MSDLATQAAKAAAGDEEAANALLQASRQYILIYAVSLLGNQHEAEDVVQDSLLVAWAKLGDLKVPEAFPSWLREIVRRQCLQRMRSRRRIGLLWSDGDRSIADAVEDPAVQYRRKEETQHVQNVLRTLPEELRTVTDLFHFRHQTQKQIAAFLNIPLSQVKNHLRKSRQLIRRRINDMTQYNQPETNGSEPNVSSSGKILRQEGTIIEVQFDQDAVPDCLDAFHVMDGSGARQDTVVIAQRLPDGIVRAIRIGTDGSRLKEGTLSYANEEVHDLPEDALDDAIRRMGVEAPASLEFCETGIKPIDLFCPLPRRGNVGLIGPMGTGKLINTEELHRRLSEAGAEVTLFAFQQLYERDLFHNMRQAIARDSRERIDHYYIPRPGKVQAVYLLSQQAFELGLSDKNLDTWPAIIHLTIELGNQGFWPAISFAESRSGLLQQAIVGKEHCRAAAEARNLLMRARDLMLDPEWLRLLANRAHRAAAKRMKIFSKERMAQLAEPDQLLVRRARKLQHFLTHPYRCAEGFTGIPGRFVPREETINGVRSILAGDCDDIDDKRFRIKGSLAECLAS